MHHAGNHQRAFALHEEALAIKRQRGDKRGIADTLVNVGELHTQTGRSGDGADQGTR